MGISKIALVEFGGSHDECLHTQIHALKQKRHIVYLILTQEVLARNSFWKDLVDEIKVVSFTKAKLHDFKIILELNRYFKKESITKVVFNTAQGGNVRNMCLTAKKSIEYIGIIHTIRKFQGSFTQKIINKKIKKYFVLSDDLLKKVDIPKGIQVKSFYPIYYPTFQQNLDKKENEIWITIVGGVEERRKDLTGLINLVNNLNNNQVRFVFLGKSDKNNPQFQHFYNAINEIDKTSNFIFFDEFVSAELFDAYLTKSDFLMPLVHPNTPSAEQYITNQISGMFNISYGYKIPLLIHRNYETEHDLKIASFFYDLNDFNNALDTAIQDRSKRIVQINTEKKWNLEEQIKQYCDFIEV